MTTPVLIVDGYNIIGSWQELKELKGYDMGSAREQLITILSACHGWCWQRIIVVFDGRSFEWEELQGVEVVFTESRETADTMIERLAAGLASKNTVEVATSDHAEYRAASAVGARVYSAAALEDYIEEKKNSYRRLAGSHRGGKMGLTELLSRSTLESLQKIRGSEKP